MSLLFGFTLDEAFTAPISPAPVGELYTPDWTTLLESITFTPVTMGGIKWYGQVLVTRIPPDLLLPYLFRVTSGSTPIWPDRSIWSYLVGGQWSEEPGPVDGLPRYLSLADAAALSASMLPLASWAAASDPLKYAALAAATIDIDRGMRFQGRKFDPAQLLEFPRAAYGSNLSHPFDWTGCGASGASMGGADAVWDWDPINQVAIVPTAIKMATLIQADSRLNGKRAAQIERLAAGVASEKVGSLSQSYDPAAILLALGGAMTLCAGAKQLLENYQIRQGRIL